MFQLLREPTGAPCRIELDGERIEATVGVNLAAWLLTREVVPFRVSVVSGAPRAPYCMMGICFECLVEVDGVRDRQACTTTIREGMRIRRQTTALGADGG